MRVLINGLGLIGGSIAYALAKFQPGVTVIGLDQNTANLSQAKQRGIIDEIGLSLTTDAPSADVIILATPVTAVEASIDLLATLPLKSEVIITDTGSTKTAICQAAQQLTDKGITFIGGHPMAGSHKSGVQAANWDLFRSAFYLLVPGANTPEAALTTLKALLQVTNAKFLVLAPQQHDHIVALLSHVPHILAASLVNTTHEDFKDCPDMVRLAAGGFRDMTRIASSDPTMWADILTTNKTEILAVLASYEAQLKALESHIAAGDTPAFFDFFAQAKVTREHIEATKRTGTLPGFFDLHVNIPDKTGSIAAITTKLAQADINIINIQILETRDDINGVLQLTFSNQHDLQQATELLGQKAVAS